MTEKSKIKFREQFLLLVVSLTSSSLNHFGLYSECLKERTRPELMRGEGEVSSWKKKSSKKSCNNYCSCERVKQHLSWREDNFRVHNTVTIFKDNETGNWWLGILFIWYYEQCCRSETGEEKRNQVRHKVTVTLNYFSSGSLEQKWELLNVLDNWDCM